MFRILNSHFQSPRYCGNCGKEILQNATFCAYCGEKVPQIDSQGVIKTPSSSYSDSSRISTIPYDSGRSFPYQYGDRREPPLPFLQHFRGVITAPQKEMAEIAKRPNLGQPIILIVIVGLIGGFASYILFSKMNITFSSAFFESMGMDPSGPLDPSTLADIMQFSLLLGAFTAPLNFLFEWIINSLILWGLFAIISSSIPSYQRNFKTAATIIGWTYLPSIIEEIFNLAYYAFFIEPMTLTVNSSADLIAIDTIGTSGETGIIFFVLGIIFHLLGVILIYFAAKAIDNQGSHAIFIALIYAIIPYILTFISLFAASSFI
ncbi:MAG: zinc ribbon domain-containing protein [Candidatus Heimdallarchaeota archaeon]|nr:zinc ribbon domain-containing protein [Candidatus Heimdallarchaeota archaeon]